MAGPTSILGTFSQYIKKNTKCDDHLSESNGKLQRVFLPCKASKLTFYLCVLIRTPQVVAEVAFQEREFEVKQGN